MVTVPVTASFRIPCRHIEASPLGVTELYATEFDPAPAPNDPVTVDCPLGPGVENPAWPDPLVTSCDRELDCVVGLNAALVARKRPFHDTCRVAAAPVLDIVEHLRGLAENFSLTRPPPIVTALSDVSQPHSLPVNRDEWVPPPDVDNGGENEMAPVS
jgi:hypothetical protein